MKSFKNIIKPMEIYDENTLGSDLKEQKSAMMMSSPVKSSFMQEKSSLLNSMGPRKDSEQKTETLRDSKDFRIKSVSVHQNAAKK